MNEEQKQAVADLHIKAENRMDGYTVKRVSELPLSQAPESVQNGTADDENAD